MFSRYFCHFLGFGVILIILGVLRYIGYYGVSGVILEFSGYIDHFGVQSVFWSLWYFLGLFWSY
jgi:hypothetical protein